MSNAIRFLEAMGGDAAMARMSHADYRAAVAALEVDAGQRRALDLRDHAALGGLLGGRARMLCMVMAPEDESETRDVPNEEQSPSEREPGDEE